ncbi:helix-turn-helix transcriptional regulator [Rhizobium sp. Root1203]|uniref:helix-turn-helix transcriptional regulator n=1 Tax=Rhizobium sp. Root1203 TaxID=1736427 RepID=UPI000A6DFCDB|nr:DNA-binding protein [Rhizobium sp. Root1203]
MNSTQDADSETLLRRSEAAALLNAAGYPIVATTLATMASRGTGPQFKRFGRVPLYRKGDLMEWAEKRSSPYGFSVSECETARTTAA